MSSMRFFVPGAALGEEERAYQELAIQCGAPIAPPGQRVYSIDFDWHGDHCTATVGERRRLTRMPITGTGDDGVGAPEVHQTGSTVLAIFNSSGTFVVCQEPVPSTGDWEQVAMCHATSVRFFEP